ncbi:hypothetical protein LEN26_011677 [Aphanomyces euteiches]|nr:hypothetical protein AeMF1_020886 [Aphanomyces euteiches]KAH9119399.1 hypothetical protein LEN26_011677 [Aphanomyces euteiches]KAH9187060.1 hypothetical protein AeNC1_010968 [Aphanomyces euteiches]
MFQTFVSDFLKSINQTQSCPDSVILVEPQDFIRDRAHSTDMNDDRVAKWDNKRLKCKNCQHIYLKCLSPTPDFCSMDCKSNAMYLRTVSEKIKAVQERAEQAQPEPAHDVKTIDIAPVVEEPEAEPVVGTYIPPATFVEFHTQKMACRPVEWSFSALY